MTEREHGRERSERETARLLELAGPREPLPEDDLEALRRHARSAWREGLSERDRPARRTGAWLGPLAAVLLLGLGVAAWWWLLRPGPVPPAGEVARVEWVAGEAGGVAGLPRTGTGVAAGATLFTASAGAPGDRLALRMEGGVEIRLDHSTAVVLDAPAAVELQRGAVYVDTGQGAAGTRHIEIRTPLGTAQDAGTRFAVRYVPRDEPHLRVRVRDGEVVVESGGRRATTTAGHQLVVRADGSLERRAAPAFGEGWEWVLEAAPSFEGRSVGDLLRWVARETGWELRFADPALASRVETATVHGSTARLRPDQAPFVVLPAAGLDADLRGGTLHVAAAD